ncbi:methyltransferase domain-containing protein [Streptomyces sp. PT12]|uniref:methyltransferase domain-containing protein n=1 Tax=Streptomyces sp. PT12 TaxID=1510197 RepID=UPI0015EEB552|nr:methyltransferase domain-containing protein [Streptomyces sp. PT12]
MESEGSPCAVPGDVPGDVPRVALADALVRVPRHRFVPGRAWALPRGGAGRWIDRGAEPGAWWDAVYSETVIYTQLDDGRTALTAESAARTYAPTSSASNPLLVLAFLRLLGPRPGDRVLEIGTGTGWTAGLLCDLTGEAERVTTVEIDPALAVTAEANLRAAGLAPRVVVGEGEKGCPDAAPFDRVHVTCGVSDVPYAWVAQTRPGGVIVLPHAPTMRLLRLTVGDDGTAAGRFHDACSFTPLRSQRRRGARGVAHTPPRERALSGGRAALADPPAGLRLLCDALLGDSPWPTEPGCVLLSDGVSKAVVARGRVSQSGPRDLWDEAEALHDAWRAEGGPGLDRLGFAVTPERQYVWLDDPSAPAARVFTSEDAGRGKA